jgi:hypothetical protein
MKVTPTWRNARRGREGISKRLDCFLIAETLFNHHLGITSWVDIGGLSDHLPILLKLESEDWKPPSPIKFNHTWLNNPEFRELVTGLGKYTKRNQGG